MVEERKNFEEQKGRIDEQNKLIDAQNQTIANQTHKISTLEGGLITTMKWKNVWRNLSVVLMILLWLPLSLGFDDVFI